MSAIDPQQQIERAIESGIKPEVKLTREHRQMIGTIAEVWMHSPELGRQLERAFVAICNGETHEN